MAQYPYFKFFASDWLGSNKRCQMTLEQQGAYINLLCRQWADPQCSLPDDDEALAKLSEMGEGWFNGGCHLVRVCFQPHPNQPGRIANQKLLGLRAERDEWVEKSRQGGRKSGAVRKMQQLKGGSTTAPTKWQPKGKQPEPEPEPKEEPPISPPKGDGSSKPSAEDAAFNEFWPHVPRKVGKDAARRAYGKAIKRLCQKEGLKPGEARDRILTAMIRFSRSPKAKGNYCPHPSTWLNEGRYQDDEACWQDDGRPGEQSNPLDFEVDDD